MLNIDKVIDKYNDNVLEDKIVEELRKEFQSKLHEGEGTKAEVSTDVNYFRVLDDTDNDISESTITTTSTLDSSDLYTTISSNSIEDYAVIKEYDQVRKVKLDKNELLRKLGFENLASNDREEIELTVVVEGRDCDKYGNPINISLY